MGGDGGVIASNRRYMRGAGTADHTGDAARKRREEPNQEKDVIRHQAARTMQTCAISQKPLFDSGNNNNSIVVCPYGRLYLKEAAVEALLKRKRGEDLLGSHIRGLKDLKEARFHLSSSSSSTLLPTCPITGRELNGQVPAFLLLTSGHHKELSTSTLCPNVVSEHGLQMLDATALEQEYGRVEEKWRLAPPPKELETIKAAWLAKIAKKKRKHVDKGHEKKRSRRSRSSNAKTSISEAARARVSEAVQKNKVLSSLFATGHDKSEKE